MAQDNGSYELQTSSKLFGGSSLNEGTYFVHSAFITTDSFITSKGEDKVFEVLEVRVFKEDNSVSRAVLRLNGCWNERKGSDGQPYKASGNFYDFLFAQCTNNNFAEARDFINSKIAGCKIDLAWKSYPTDTGFGHVAEVKISSSEKRPVPPLPADWKPLHKTPPLPSTGITPNATTPTVTGTATQTTTATTPLSNDLPF